jgi:hypothetical protein
MLPLLLLSANNQPLNMEVNMGQMIQDKTGKEDKCKLLLGTMIWKKT